MIPDDVKYSTSTDEFTCKIRKDSKLEKVVLCNVFDYILHLL